MGRWRDLASSLADPRLPLFAPGRPRPPGSSHHMRPQRLQRIPRRGTRIGPALGAHEGQRLSAGLPRLNTRTMTTAATSRTGTGSVTDLRGNAASRLR